MRYGPFIITSAQSRVRYKLLCIVRSMQGREKLSNKDVVVLRPVVKEAGECDAPARVRRRLQPYYVPVRGVAPQSVPSSGSLPDV